MFLLTKDVQYQRVEDNLRYFQGKVVSKYNST